MYKFLILIFLTSCTLSFNNISTKGQATDVLDEEQSADAKVDPVLTIPPTII